MLKIYDKAGSLTEYSSDGTNPFTITLDASRGGILSKQLFIRNDDIEVYYEDIVISITDTGSISKTDGTNGWSWKLYEGNHHPPLETWYDIAHGNSISLSSDIGSSIKGDISTYLPFWVRIEIPSNQDIQVVDDIYLTISATEKLV